MRKQFKISDEEIVELYLSGLSLKDIAKSAQDNIGLIALRKKLHTLGVDTSRSAVSKKYGNKISKARHKYHLDEYIFENIDTEEKAYWLGFLMADGYNHESKTCVAIKIQAEDIETLEQLKSFLNYDGPIHFYTRETKVSHLTREYCELYICSPIFSKILAEKGCVQGKTYALQFPEYLPKSLINHFIRGYFDGDGCLSITKRKDRASSSLIYQFNMVGTKDFVEKVKSILVEELSLTNTITMCYSKAATIRWSGKNVVTKIMKYLYKNATVYMKRKHDKYLYMVSR